MHRTSTILVAGCLALLVVTGCSKKVLRGFYHQAHRQRYAITTAELKDLQLYISKDVVVHTRSQPGVPSEPVIILAKYTPGVVVQAGPDWLQVSFEKGGQGIRFVADASKTEDLYWFATARDDQPGLFKLSVLPEKDLLFEGQHYLVLEGADANLLVEKKDIEKLINSRPHVQGRSVK